MKKTIVSVALAILMLNAYSQGKKEAAKDETKVTAPEAALKTLNTKFPKAKKIVWSLEKEGEYEADFLFNKMKTSAVFDQKGKLLLTESEIKEVDLPPAVKSTLAKDFAGYTLAEIEKSDAKGLIKFEIKAKKDDKGYKLVFDKKGKLVSQEENIEIEKTEESDK